MEKMMRKLSDSVLDKLSMDFLRNQVLKMLTAMTTPLSPPGIPEFFWCGMYFLRWYPGLSAVCRFFWGAF